MSHAQHFIQIDCLIQITENLIVIGIAVQIVRKHLIKSIHLNHIYVFVCLIYLLQWYANTTMQYKTAKENHKTDN